MKAAKTTLRWLMLVAIVPVIALMAWTPAEATVDANTELHTQKPGAGALVRRLSVDDPMLQEAPSIETDLLMRYLYESMRAWTKLPDAAGDAEQIAKAHELVGKSAAGPWAAGSVEAEKRAVELAETHEKMRGRYAEIAADIVTVVRSEKPAFPSDENRFRTAVLLAGVAFYEAAFQHYVDAGLCNDWKWRHPTTTGPDAMTIDEVKNRKAILAAGSCDGGWAFSMWQIHPYSSGWTEGIVLLDDGKEWSFAEYVHDGQEHQVIKGKDLIADRRTAARVALHMLRRALGPKAANGLCGYTGEGSNCWKASLRENFATDWATKHPFAG